MKVVAPPPPDPREFQWSEAGDCEHEQQLMFQASPELLQIPPHQEEWKKYFFLYTSDYLIPSQPGSVFEPGGFGWKLDMN